MPSPVLSYSRQLLTYHYPEDHALTRAGGFNRKIAVVHARHTPRPTYIKKVFLPQDVRSGHAAREIDYLKHLRGSPSICKLIAYTLDPTTGYGAMVLKHYSHGSLEKLITLHKRVGISIPRGFIWKVFLALAEALTWMRYGPDSHEGSWNFIIHRDIHPGNVFLGPLSATQYPLVVLGDFGCSIDRPRYVRDWVSTSTRAARASRWHRHYRTPETPYPRTKSDVYQVGLVIVSLCKLTCNPRAFDETYPAGRREELRLSGLLRRCLERDYDRRIDPRVLRDELRREVRRMSGGEGGLLLAGPLDTLL
ncbi:hypothetical protein N0V90_003192 [Kalmusia sp. IMI 367209]|nr:hypothetical protein N0V90_003192 [Kalmusia sp. IMI 367209]